MVLHNHLNVSRTLYFNEKWGFPELKQNIVCTTSNSMQNYRNLVCLPCDAYWGVYNRNILSIARSSYWAQSLIRRVPLSGGRWVRYNINLRTPCECDTMRYNINLLDTIICNFPPLHWLLPCFCEMHTFAKYVNMTQRDRFYVHIRIEVTMFSCGADKILSVI